MTLSEMIKKCGKNFNELLYMPANWDEVSDYGRKKDIWRAVGFIDKKEGGTITTETIIVRKPTPEEAVNGLLNKIEGK